MILAYFRTGSFSHVPVPLSWYSPSLLLHQSSLAFLLEAILNKSDHICPQRLPGPARDMMPDYFGVCLMFRESSLCLCFPEERDLELSLGCVAGKVSGKKRTQHQE